MSTMNQNFAVATRTLAVCDHPLVRRANLGFALNQPFSWTLINAAATAARMLDDAGYCAEQMESEHVRDDVVNSEFNIERYDQLVIKMATLRHFNRQACGINEISMGQINACLKPDEATVSLEDIKAQARDRVKIERRMGKLKPADVAARFKELVMAMYETASSRKRQLQRLVEEVSFLCNRSDDMLLVRQYENQLDAHRSYLDAELADYGQYDYMVEGLVEKCVEPIIRAKDELQRVMDRSYRTETQIHGSALMAEIDRLASDLGINFKKLEDQEQLVNQLIDASEKSEATAEAEIDTLDVVIDEVEFAPKKKVTRIKKAA